MPEIPIIIPFYNFDVCLAMLIFFVLFQTYTDFTLLLNGDESKKSPKDIIKRYCKKKCNSINFIKYNCKRSVTLHFRYLPNHVESGYYKFCTQNNICTNDKFSIFLFEVVNFSYEYIIVFNNNLKICLTDYKYANSVIGIDKIFSFSKTIQKQIITFKFVRDYTHIIFFKCYCLKLKFNHKRLKEDLS